MKKILILSIIALIFLLSCSTKEKIISPDSNTEHSVLYINEFMASNGNTIADENGEFAFLPDAELSLNWDVQARKAGHGDMIHFSLTEKTEVINAQRGFTTLQIILRQPE